MRVKYTLDRVESDLYVLVEKGNEANELIIPSGDININLTEKPYIELDRCKVFSQKMNGIWNKK